MISILVIMINFGYYDIKVLYKRKFSGRNRTNLDISIYKSHTSQFF